MPGLPEFWASIFSVPWGEHSPWRWFIGGRIGHLAFGGRKYLGSNHFVYRCSTNDPFFLAHASLTFPYYHLPSSSRPFWGSVGQTGLLLVNFLFGRHLGYSLLHSTTEVTSPLHPLFHNIYWSLMSALVSCFFVLLGLCFLSLYYYFHGVLGRNGDRHMKAVWV